MRAQFGAQFCTLALCSALLVSCASNGNKQPYVHSKARKVEASSASVLASPPVASPPVPVAAARGTQAAPAPVDLAQLPAAPVIPQPQTRPVIPPPPQAALPTLTQLPTDLPKDLSSEIPTRAARRDVATWTTPPPKTPPAAPAVRVRVAPAPSAAGTGIVAPATPPAKSAPAPIAIAAPSTPPQASGNTPAPLVISRATGAIEARLPCNRAASPHCDLRIYQINVGTFVDGSTQHTPLSGYGPGPHTGDLEGAMGALEHIKALGFNAIWLSPIFDTKAGEAQKRVSGPSEVNTRLDGTGYFPRDYFQIDPQFGTLEVAQNLVNEAHVLGLKVIFDGVFGHNKGGVAASPSGALPVDATSLSAYDGAPARYPGRIVNYADPRSTAFYKEVARHWIDTLGIDGWRLDQVYQIPSQPLREITIEIGNAANAQLLSGYVVGEMWGTAAQIRDVLGPSDKPILASAFDFPTRYALVQVLASDENGGSEKPASTINEAWAMGAHATYPDHAIMNLMLGNHDLVRFGDLIERAGKGGPSSANYWAIHKMAFTFMAAWSGPITLYYGEEIGAEVAGFSAKVPGDCASLNQCDDHVARNMVAIPGVNTPVSAGATQSRDLKVYLSALMGIRAANPALSSGARTHVYSDTELYIDLKSSGTDRYILVMNTGASSRQMTLRPTALGLTSLRNGRVIAGQTLIETTNQGLVLTVPALGATIIKLEGA
jgi:cyclomaltodextrinase / maltogenic alpha-amylase / neopullulanase